MNPIRTMMTMTLTALTLNGCLLGHSDTEMPVAIGIGVNPTLTWDGGPATSVEVQEDLADGGWTTVWWIDSPADNNGDSTNLVPSGIAIGTELPSGMSQYHPGTNSWDQTFEAATLEVGHHYIIVVDRSSGPTQLEYADLMYTP